MARPPNPFFRPVQQALLVILLALAVVGVVLALYSTRWIVLAALMGIGLGVLFSPAIEWMRVRLRIPNGIGAFILFLLAMTACAGIAFLVIDLVSDQLVPLGRRMPELLASARERLVRLARRYPWLQEQIRELRFAPAPKDAGGTLVRGLTLGATAVGGFFFVLAVALYFAVSPRNYVAGFLSLFPAHMRGKAREVLRESGMTLRSWMLAQMIAMGSVGTATGAALWLIGIDYWAIFGFLTAALDIVPYIGPIVAAGSVLIVTLGTHPEKAWWVLVVFVLIQQLESDLVIPLVMKGRMALPPIQLMTLMLMLGAWFGVLGVLVAPPLFAVGRTVYVMTYVARMDRLTVPPTKAHAEKAA